MCKLGLSVLLTTSPYIRRSMLQFLAQYLIGRLEGRNGTTNPDSDISGSAALYYDTKRKER